LADGMTLVPGIGGVLQWLTPILLDAVVGIVVGALVLAVVIGARNFLRRRRVESRS
jgi:hypothetical protein